MILYSKEEDNTWTRAETGGGPSKTIQTPCLLVSTVGEGKNQKSTVILDGEKVEVTKEAERLQDDLASASVSSRIDLIDVSNADPELINQFLEYKDRPLEHFELLKNPPITFEFAGFPCKLRFQEYDANNSLALQLSAAYTDLDKDLYEGEPIATASVCIPKFTPPEGTILIKDYSENQGMAQALLDANIARPHPTLPRSPLPGTIVLALSKQARLLASVQLNKEIPTYNPTIKKPKPGPDMSF